MNTATDKTGSRERARTYVINISAFLYFANVRILRYRHMTYMCACVGTGVFLKDKVTQEGEAAETRVCDHYRWSEMILKLIPFQTTDFYVDSSAYGSSSILC